jgi:hypothetical protein
MKTPAGSECKYYYEDFHRRATQECRLIARNRDSLLWSPELCTDCPVPRILVANQCAHLLLKATVVRQYLVFRRVQVQAYCDHKQEIVAQPQVGCGECARLRSQ